MIIILGFSNSWILSFCDPLILWFFELIILHYYDDRSLLLLCDSDYDSGVDSVILLTLIVIPTVSLLLILILILKALVAIPCCNTPEARGPQCLTAKSFIAKILTKAPLRLQGSALNVCGR